MAPVEIDFCISRPNSGERTVREKSVARRNIYKSNFLAPAKVLVICDPQDNFGTVTVKGRRFVGVWIYENENDLEGRRIRSNRPIKFSGDQEVEIWANNKRRKMHVQHEKEEDDLLQSLPRTPEQITV